MMSDAASHPIRRALLIGTSAALLFVLGLGIWFLTRKITPGAFVVRIVPSGPPRAFSLSLLGPGGGKIGDWHFVDVPGPKVLAGLEEKVPWKAVATDASPQRPCLTLETAPSIPQAALSPVEHLALSQCCPGMTDAARCPIRRVMLGR